MKAPLPSTGKVRLVGYSRHGPALRVAMSSFAEQFTAAVAAAKTFRQIDVVSRTLWKAHGAGLIDDAAAQGLAEALQAQKQASAGRAIPTPISRASGPRRPTTPRSPDRERSLRRRRACAMSGAVPSRIAAAFTLAEIAVLSIVAGEVRRSGDCRLPIDAIAALAGTSRSVVKRALRQAQHLGLLAVEQRPRPGAKNLSNVVRIISADWRAWLRLGNRGPKRNHHVNQSNNQQADSCPIAFSDRQRQLRNILRRSESNDGRCCADGPGNGQGVEGFRAAGREADC